MGLTGRFMPLVRRVGRLTDDQLIGASSEEKARARALIAGEVAVRTQAVELLDEFGPLTLLGLRALAVGELCDQTTAVVCLAFLIHDGIVRRVRNPGGYDLYALTQA